jgi:hypothetical protein
MAGGIMSRRVLIFGFVLLTFLSGFAQAPPARTLSPTARLTGAKTVLLKNVGGSEVPFNVISEGVQNWGHYRLVEDPEKADLIIEIAAPNGGNGVSVTSTTGNDPKSGFPTQSVTSSRELSVARITMIVYDAKSKVALWSASEQPKGGVREKTRKDNVVEASQHLVTKFRERVEPEAK